MQNKQRGVTAVEVFVVAIAVIGFGGWVANIVKLIGMDFGVITGMLVVRAIGVFVAPLGSVLGFF